MRDLVSEVDLNNAEDILRFYAIEIYKIKNFLTEGKIIQSYNMMCKLAAETAKGINYISKDKENESS